MRESILYCMNHYEPIDFHTVDISKNWVVSSMRAMKSCAAMVPLHAV